MNPRKQVSVLFTITTVQDPIQLEKGVAKIFENSVLSMPEFQLKVDDVKVKEIKENED